MYCPVCNSPISATDVRCIDCGTLLIESAEKRSPEFKAGAYWVDKRIYYGIGAILGFLIAVALFYGFPDRLPLACAVGAAIGGGLGKTLAARKWL